MLSEWCGYSGLSEVWGGEMRSKFEGLAEIAKVLEQYDGYRVGEKYSTYDTGATAWLNGAWYAFQEREKRIEAVINYINGCYCTADVDMNDIQELLK